MLERHPSAIRDLIEMRVVLEAHAASLAAIRATPADLKKIEAALEAQMRGRSKNLAALAKRDLDFHQSIAQASHNIALLHTAHGLSKLIKAFVQHGYETILSSDDAKGRRAEVERQHFAILGAIRARDPEAARQAAYAHLCSTESVWPPMPQAASGPARR
jgi:GntR family transcriptional repressor for pyruvate dehydrogenase complex